MTLFKGVAAAMVTPFDGNGQNGGINYAVLDRYIEHLIGGGVNALVPFGTTGEPATLSDDEYVAAAEHIISRVNGRVPVILGAGSNSTAHAVKLVARAKALGADGALVVTPYYNKCTQRGIIEHYRAVCSAGLPVIVYNVPSRTGVDILPDTLGALADIDGIAGIKEANGNISRITETAMVCERCGLPLYSGNDDLIAVTMALGGSGVISVAANPAPKLIAKLCDLCFANDYPAARALQFELDELIKALFCEVNPIPVKKAMHILGFDVGAPRLPLTQAEPEHAAALERAMKKLGLVK